MKDTDLHFIQGSPALEALRDFLIPLGKGDCYRRYVGNRALLVCEEGWASAEAKLWNCWAFEQWRHARALTTRTTT